jgi:hypothetical protein
LLHTAKTHDRLNSNLWCGLVRDKVTARLESSTLLLMGAFVGTYLRSSTPKPIMQLDAERD